MISLEWDYCYDSVLVDRSRGPGELVLCGPVDLGLSPALAGRLSAWLAEQETASGHWVRQEPDTAESLAEEARLRRELLHLAHAVQHELGDSVEVLVGGEPLAGAHRR